MNKLSAPRTQLLLVRVIFIACVAVLIGNVLRFTVNLFALDPATPQRAAARDALINMHRLLQLVIDAERGERVYRVAGNQGQHDPLRAARDQYRGILNVVALQMPGNPVQLASLLHLRTSLTTRFDDLERSIVVFDRRRLGPVLQPAPADGPIALIHRIQALVATRRRVESCPYIPVKIRRQAQGRDRGAHGLRIAAGDLTGAAG